MLCEDLFFRAKIETTARAAGRNVTFCRQVCEVAEAAAGKTGALVLVDLGNRAGDPIAAIRDLQNVEPRPTIVAYGSHQDRDGLIGARDAGADQVLARSTFSERLPALLLDVNGG